MDVKATEAAGRPELVSFAAAIADNGCSLLADAELLLSNGRHARAFALAALAIEEFGKVGGVITLAVIPDAMRGQVPVRELLEWHALKQMAGQIMKILQFGVVPGTAGRLDAEPVDQLGQMLAATEAQSRITDRTKLRGLYVDMDTSGGICRPDDVTEQEAQDQITRAREVAASAAMFKDPEALNRLANPPAEAMQVSAALFGSYFSAAKPETADATAQAVKDGVDVVLATLARAAASAQAPDAAVR